MIEDLATKLLDSSLPVVGLRFVRVNTV